MATLRTTCWTIIVLLLLEGSGALSLVHKFSHHSGVQREQGQSVCDHDLGRHAPVRDDVPSPDPDDDDCSICLGLAGLHLAMAIDPVEVEGATQRVEQRICVTSRVRSCDVLDDRPARAPPAC